jgi:AraC family transcriptional regulator
MSDNSITKNKYLYKEYISRINRVIDYIDNNLNTELTLKILASISNFSPFHFHRIFSSITRETLYQYIQRIRIEKAAGMLIANPEKTITEIAMDCGFSNSATFARAFKGMYKISASEWKNGGFKKYSNNGKTDSNNHQKESNNKKDYQITSNYNDHINQFWRIKMKTRTNADLDFTVDVKEISEMPVAYVRHTGPYKGDSALFESLYNKLMTWAGPRGLINFPKTKMFTVYHDSPEITEEQNLRISACITVPAGTKVDGEIGYMLVPGGKYAIGHFEIDDEQYEAAWNGIFGSWLPESGYQCDDRACFEMCLNKPDEHPEGKHIVDIYIPVKPL